MSDTLTTVQALTNAPKGMLDDFAKSAPRTFMAGAAAVDITPAKAHRQYLAGFDYGRRCTGVNDPIFARALVLWDGQTPLVIVSLDLIGLSLARTRLIRSLLTSDYADSVFIACTHNHQAPDTLGLWGESAGGVLPLRSGMDHRYMEQLTQGVLGAVQKALQGMRAARIHFASGAFDTNGRWITNLRSKVLDREMRVMSLRSAEGGIIATLVQHACHPETLGEENTLLSGDFCSACCKQLERDTEGVALYVSGSLGAMVTAAIPGDSSLEERLNFSQELGRAMARSAQSLVNESSNDHANDPTIATSCVSLRVPKEGNPFYQLLDALSVVEPRDMNGGLETEINLARIGPVSMLGLPGEPSPELGLELLERLPGDQKFIFGLTNDELGYLMPPEFFWDQIYSYERTMSPGPLTALNLSLGLEDLLKQIYNRRSDTNLLTGRRTE